MLSGLSRFFFKIFQTKPNLQLIPDKKSREAVSGKKILTEETSKHSYEVLYAGMTLVTPIWGIGGDEGKKDAYLAHIIWGYTAFPYISQPCSPIYNSYNY